MGIKADKIKNVHVKQPNGQYSTIPLSGGGYATPQMYGAVGDGVTDDTEAFKKAFDSGQKIIIPQASYNLSQFIWTDDSVVLIDLGKYQSGTGKLIISKALTNSPLFEKSVIQFNPYLDVTTNNTTTAFDNDVYSQSYTGNAAGSRVLRRVQGVCYDDQHDVFAFGFCEYKNRATEKALLVFYKLNSENHFEYKGHGFLTYGGHLNSMCFRKEGQHGCIYASCTGDNNNPPTPTNGKTAIQEYGGGRIQAARIPVIVNSNGTFSIPSQEEILTKGNNEGFGNYGINTVNYNKIQYFCGITVDGSSTGQSYNRALYRIAYDKINDIFYVDYGRINLNEDGTRANSLTYFLKPFSLEGNKWTPLFECPYYYNETQFVENVNEGVADLNQGLDDIRKKLGLSEADKTDLENQDIYIQAPTVINEQLIGVSYLSNNVKHYGNYNNGTIIIQYNYKTRGAKKIYRLASYWPKHQPQCIVQGKNGNIYLFNDLGVVNTVGNKPIKVTQITFDEQVCAIQENPYIEPKRLNENYLQYHGVNSSINLNFITEIGSYIFNGDYRFSVTGANITGMASEYSASKIINGPGDTTYYFTLYVLPLAEHSRLQIYLSEHGQIYVRNGYFGDSGSVGWVSWRQIIETGRKGAGRSGSWRGAGYLNNTSTVNFTIPFPTAIISAARPSTPTLSVSSLTLRQKAAKVVVDTNNIVTQSVSVGAWGYNVTIQSNVVFSSGSVNFEVGPVGVQVSLSITF